MNRCPARDGFGDYPGSRIVGKSCRGGDDGPGGLVSPEHWSVAMKSTSHLWLVLFLMLLLLAASLLIKAAFAEDSKGGTAGEQSAIELSAKVGDGMIWQGGEFHHRHIVGGQI